MKKISLFAMVAFPLLTLAGCKDPVIASWESADKVCDIHRDEFTLEGSSDDLTGDGAFWFKAYDDSCVNCNGTITGKQKREDQYTFSVRFSGEHGCSELPRVEAECGLKSNDTLLQCDFDLAGNTFSLDFDNLDK